MSRNVYIRALSALLALTPGIAARADGAKNFPNVCPEGQSPCNLLSGVPAGDNRALNLPVSPRKLAAAISADPQLLNLRAQAADGANPAVVTPRNNLGLIDGVYACDVSVGGKSERSLITFNGHANGQTIYIVAALKTYVSLNATDKIVPPAFRGFGVGQLSTTGLAGTTWDGQAFSFTLLGLEQSRSQGPYDVLRLAGRVGVAPNQTATMNCKTDRVLD